MQQTLVYYEIIIKNKRNSLDQISLQTKTILYLCVSKQTLKLSHTHVFGLRSHVSF
jgi:hypothetical protein